jgi:hypothetical protein
VHLTNDHRRITKFNSEVVSEAAAFRKKEQMIIEDILEALAHKDRKFPREALEQVIARKDEITPHLLKILERVADEPDEAIEREDYSYFYAIYLLAQFRERRAYPLIVRIASLPPKTVDALLGDTITEGLPKILASVCGGDTSLIKQLAENTEAEKFVRGSALLALAALVVSGDLSREEVMSYYSHLFDEKLKEEPSEEVEIALTNLVNCATDLYPEELYDKIEKAFDEDMIDESSIDLEFVDETMAEGKEAVLARLHKDPHLQLVESVIKEMEWWAWYRQPGYEDDYDESVEDSDLDVEEIMQILAYSDNDSPLPRNALRQAIAKKDEITPHLLKALERAANSPVEVLAEVDFSYAYAMYLLAQFREKRAYPLIIKLASHPPELVDELFRDIITEDLHNILAAVSLGDTSLIEELVVNTEAEECVRGAAIRSWLTLVACGEKSREEAVAYYRKLFEGGLEDKNEVVWSELADCATDLHPQELYGYIRRAIEDGLIDDLVIGLDWVDHQMARSKENVLVELPEYHHPIKDTISEMEWWSSYRGFDDDWDEGEDWDDEDWDEEDWDEEDWDDEDRDDETRRIAALNGHNVEPHMPYRAPQKIGRNEPCPCGSGKKYKKCCGA